MGKLSVVVGVVALLIAAERLSAHEGHLHKVMGTVTEIDATRVQVDTQEGKKLTFLLTPDTKYLKGKKAAAPSDVTAGARVVLSVVQKDGKESVTEVLLGATQPESHKH